MNEKAQEKAKELDLLTDFWTLDYAVEAFVIYFSDKKWLIREILEKIEE